MLDPIFHLIYVSKTDVLKPGDLGDILFAARKNNPPLNLTGVLIYNSDFFFQLLEGPASNVEKMYKIICDDPRHIACKTLHTYTDYHRKFTQWSMGYIPFDEIKFEEKNPYNLESYNSVINLSPDRTLSFLNYLKKEFQS
ncbi:BLUF domain protein [Magnetococcus marinus MC-1]|uniref:BLUF domain protein n=1 Tax=Magnetococcus marinus (strain ATCC BAA-1437 / JCM 17883 / MC-1) TaxID=156889 RepID=A0L5S5_MAGMM|nr:BLUF domain-containing protein [Magnetococcus marinus]ABK43318.1 BLUF domain protein [Magnetococcus marinus MC-1]